MESQETGKPALLSCGLKPIDALEPEVNVYNDRVSVCIQYQRAAASVGPRSIESCDDDS